MFRLQLHIHMEGSAVPSVTRVWPSMKEASSNQISLSMQKWLILLYWWIREYPVFDASDQTRHNWFRSRVTYQYLGMSTWQSQFYWEDQELFTTSACSCHYAIRGVTRILRTRRQGPKFFGHHAHKLNFLAAYKGNYIIIFWHNYTAQIIIVTCSVNVTKR